MPFYAYGYINDDMVDWADIIRRLRSERQQTQMQFASSLGTTQATVSRWESGKQRPDREQTQAIAALSGRALEELVAAPGGPAEVLGETPSPPVGETGEPRGLVHDLPILGHAEAGADGTFLDNGAITGYAGRPSCLEGVNGAYALIVHNESMLPRYEPREIVEVDPSIPVQPGDYVVLQTTDDRAFIKRLVRRTDRAVILEQYNPAREIHFPPEQIRALHLIVGAHRVFR